MPYDPLDYRPPPSSPKPRKAKWKRKVFVQLVALIVPIALSFVAVRWDVTMVDRLVREWRL